MKKIWKKPKDFSKSSNADKAYEAVIRYLSRRDHAPLELKQKLTRFYETETAEAAIRKATERGYVRDDQSLTRVFSRSLSKKNKSHRQINAVLAKKGLSPIDFDEDLELTKCHELLIRKFGENVSFTAPERVKVYRYLTNRGFKLETIKKAIKQSDTMNEN